MRILLLTQHFWPESFRINEVAEDLVAIGHEVVVLTGQPNYPGGRVLPGYRSWGCETQRHGGVTIQRVPLVPRGGASALRLVTNYLSFILSASIVGSWRLRGQRFDVVFVYATSPLLQALAAVVLARLKGCALVTWIQDLWPQALRVTGYVRSPLVLAAVARVVRWIYARNDLLLLQSPAFESPVRALAPPSLPMRYHPNPGDRTITTAPDTRAVLRLEEGFNVVFAGNLGTAQGLDTVLDAAEQLQRDAPAARIVLVGSGQLDAWLATEVERRALANVRLTGRVPPSAISGILAQASALLVCLKGEEAVNLTLPSKVQTYLATAKPIIAALDGEGARVVQESGAGIVCPAGDGTALAAAVRQMMELSADVRERMGASGRRYHDEHFDADRLIRALGRHLEDAVRLHRRV